MNRIVITTIAVVVVAVGAWFHGRGDRDARRIHARLDGLVEAVEKTAGEGHLRLLARTQSIPGYFTSDAVIQLSPLYGGTLTRRDVASYLTRTHASVDRLTIRLSDRSLEVTPDAESAVMRLVAHGRVEWGSQSESHVHPFHIDWLKKDGEWYIQRVSTVQAIRRPGTSL